MLMASGCSHQRWQLVMVLIVSPHFAASIQKQLTDLGHDSHVIGTVHAATPDEERVVLK